MPPLPFDARLSTRAIVRTDATGEPSRIELQRIGVEAPVSSERLRELLGVEVPGASDFARRYLVFRSASTREASGWVSRGALTVTGHDPGDACGEASGSSARQPRRAPSFATARTAPWRPASRCWIFAGVAADRSRVAGRGRLGRELESGGRPVCLAQRR